MPSVVCVAAAFGQRPPLVSHPFFSAGIGCTGGKEAITMDWMDRERNFWIVGGDLRQRALARLLREDGHTVHIAALEGEGLVAEPLGPGLALAHCVILPLPVTRRGEILHTPLSREEVTLPQLLDWLEPGQVLCGGMVDPQAAAAAQARGLRLLDYYAREECMVANAVPTKEAVGPKPYRERMATSR